MALARRRFMITRSLVLWPLTMGGLSARSGVARKAAGAVTPRFGMAVSTNDASGVEAPLTPIRTLVVGALVLIVVSALLLLAACSGDETPGGGSQIDLATAVVGDPVEVPAENVTLPPGSTSAKWVEVGDEQLCVAILDAATTEPRRECNRWAGSLDFGSFSWSADGSTLFFTEGFRLRFDEPDIWSFDVASGALTNRTDDGTDELFGDRSVLDTSPFTNDAGVLHFFTLDRDPAGTELNLLDTDGDVRPLPGISLSEAQPISEIHRLGNDRFLYTAFAGSDRGELLLLLDLASGGTREIDVRGIEAPLILGAAPGIAVVTDREQAQRFGDARLEFIDLDLDGERIRNVDLGAIDPTYLPTVGFSPDASTLLAIVRPVDGDDLQLIGLQRTSTGDFGDPIVLAPAGFLGTDADGDPRFPRAVRSFPRIVWTESNQLLIPADDGVMLVFDLSSGDEDAAQ